MATRAIGRKASFMCSTSLTVSCNDIYSSAEDRLPQRIQPTYTNNYSPSPQSTAVLGRLIPTLQCPRCLRLVDGRPWAGSDQLWAYACECGWARVITSPSIAEARERVRETCKTRKQGGVA